MIVWRTIIIKMSVIVLIVALIKNDYVLVHKKKSLSVPIAAIIDGVKAVCI